MHVVSFVGVSQPNVEVSQLITKNSFTKKEEKSIFIFLFPTIRQPPVTTSFIFLFTYLNFNTHTEGTHNNLKNDMEKREVKYDKTKFCHSLVKYIFFFKYKNLIFLLRNMTLSLNC